MDEYWTVFCLGSHDTLFRGTLEECREFSRKNRGAYSIAKGEQRI